MNTFSRLFDCITIQAEHPKNDLLAGKINATYHKLSTSEVHQKINQLAAGLIKIGIGPKDGTTEGRDKICIMSKGCPEWLISDLAIQSVGAISVPLYPTLTEHDVLHIFKESEVSACFVYGKEIYDLILKIKDQVPSLKHIYTFEKCDGIQHWEALLPKELSDLDKAAIDNRKVDTKEDDVASIIYTSGTTGNPKGVMLSHKNIVSNLTDVKSIIENVGFDERRALSFLPLNHILERMISYVYLFYGFSIYYAESIETIGADLQVVKPSFFVTVPRLLEKVYERIMAKGAELKGIKKALFFWAVDLGKKYEIGANQSWWYKQQLSIANKLIFSKWRAALGGNIRAIVVGGAACQTRLINIFSAAQIIIMEGYGLTETSPVIAVNHSDDNNRRAGTVGPVIEGVQVKLADDGEILCKGNNVMLGYYKNPEGTAETFVDGWFATGDIGEFVEGKFLKITDRKKELFKTSGGKYVAPQQVENKLKESKYVEQVMVVGGGRKFVSALIVPAKDALNQYLAEHNVSTSNWEEAVQHPQTKHLFENILNYYNPQFNHVEQIKKFALLTTDWTTDSGELTPKLSLKRKFILNKYDKELDLIYENHAS